jgi:protein SCO1/2
MQRIYAFLLLLLLIASVACSKKPDGKHYELQGTVVAVDSGAHQLTVAHQDIPGLMPGMTMPFLVGRNDEWVFGKIAPGDQVHATLVLGERAELDDISFSKQAPDSSDGSSQLRLPQPGDQVPDFTLVNQNGRRIHLSEFRGKPLLLTFIYTRCPMPDFCLLMSNNFSEILKELHQQPQVFPRVQLLSISIDPVYDTPEVLRNYGSRYAGSIDPRFQHWQFATGSPEQIRQAANYFGLAYNQASGQIVHSLSTVLIGADGKVLKVYTGNGWKPEEVAREFAAVTGS